MGSQSSSAEPPRDEEAADAGQCLEEGAQSMERDDKTEFFEVTLKYASLRLPSLRSLQKHMDGDSPSPFMAPFL